MYNSLFNDTCLTVVEEVKLAITTVIKQYVFTYNRLCLTQFLPLIFKIHVIKKESYFKREVKFLVVCFVLLQIATICEYMTQCCEILNI